MTTPYSFALARSLGPLAVALLLFVPMASHAADNAVVAKVGASEVKADDIKPFIEKLSVKDQLQLSKNPAAMNEYVRGLIVQQLVYKEALAKKWDQQPQVVAALDKLRQQAITQSYLQSVAAPAQDFPSAADIQSAYDQLKKANALQVPKQYHLAQIYVACPKGADKETEAKAQAALDTAVKAAKSGDFSDSAKQLSNDPTSAAKGGDLGFLAESQIQPEIRSAVSSLAKGGVSDPVRLNDGWHVLKLVEVKDPYTATLDEVKVSLTGELRNQKAQVLGKAYLAKLLQDNPVTLNEIAVSKLIDPKGN